MHFEGTGTKGDWGSADLIHIFGGKMLYEVWNDQFLKGGIWRAAAASESRMAAMEVQLVDTGIES
jgi:hypothetical protein